MPDVTVVANPIPSPRRVGLLVLGLSLVLAFLSARPWAGGWNDASRLASVETVVDYDTLSIDRSIYVKVPTFPRSPYRPGWTEIMDTGTLDRMLVNGRFYSDKPPLTTLLLATEYAGVKAVTGLTARDAPGAFAWTITVLSSGVWYALAVTGVWYTACLLRLNPRHAVVLTAAFALSTVSVVYARHVNSHVMLLGVAVWVFACMIDLTRPDRNTDRRWPALVRLGLLVGFGYTLESAAGPLLGACVGLWTIFRLRNRMDVLIVGFSAVPWVAAHHALNYMVFGVIGPANANPAYFNFPGSAVNTLNMTGIWNHASIVDFLSYSIGLWSGRRGFMMHNLPLLIALPGAAWLLRRRVPHRAELAAGMAWVVGVAMVYGILSTENSRGYNCSVRWFVPLLAPLFLALMLLLNQVPRLVTDLVILATFGAVANYAAWDEGPFMVTPIARVWPPVAMGLLCWGAWGVYRAKFGRPRSDGPDDLLPAGSAA